MIALSLKPLTDEDAVEFEFERIERAREFAANELAEWLGASMDPGNGATGDSCDGEEVARIALDYIALELEVNAGGTGTTWLTFGIDPDGVASS